MRLYLREIIKGCASNKWLGTLLSELVDLLLGGGGGGGGGRLRGV